jgi:uncharacterized membrane protein YeaQ/YmgE (transglycosylase-associated protein family)
MHGVRSWLISLGLGLLGTLVGFSVFHGIFGIGDTDRFDWGGIVGAVIGAIIVVAVASFLINRFAKRRAAGQSRSCFIARTASTGADGEPGGQVRERLALAQVSQYLVRDTNYLVRDTNYLVGVTN